MVRQISSNNKKTVTVHWDDTIFVVQIHNYCQSFTETDTSSFNRMIEQEEYLSIKKEVHSYKFMECQMQTT